MDENLGSEFKKLKSRMEWVGRIPLKKPENKSITSVAESLSKIIQAAAGLAAVGYIMGYLCLRMYYGTFGARWLIEVVPTRTFLLSNLHMVLFLFSCFLIFLFSLLSRTIDPEKKGLLWLFHFFFEYPYFYPIPAAIILFLWGKTEEVKLFWISVLWISCVAAGFYVHYQEQMKFGLWNWLGIVIGIFFLIFVPLRNGYTLGLLDRAEATTTLPIVESRDKTRYRLLIATDTKFYVATLSSNGNYNPSIKVLDSTQVSTVIENE